MEDREGRGDLSVHPAPNLGLRDIRPALAVLKAARRIDSIRDAAARTVGYGERRGTWRSKDYLVKMFGGREPMNPDVLNALHACLGFESRGSESLGFDLRIWDSAAAMREALGPGPLPLLAVLRGLERSRPPCAALVHVGPRLARVQSDVGPPRLARGAHPFELRHQGFREAWVLMLEYERALDTWWSLQGSDAARIDGRTIGETRLKAGGVTPLTLKIGGQAAICDLFALVSSRPFALKIVDMLPETEGTRDTLPVRDRDLAAALAGPAAGTPGIVVASFIYEV